MVSVVAASAPAGASPLDVLGLGSRRAGQANAGIAAADDAAAVYENPAGLLGRPACRRDDERHDKRADNGRRNDRDRDDTCDAATRTGELVLGTVGEYSHLSINGIRAPLADAGAAQLAVRVGLASRFALGFAMSAPSSHLGYAVIRAPDQPYYPYYRDRLSRAVLLVGAAVRVTDQLGIGGSLDLAPGFMKSRAIAGVTARLSSTLRAGFAYHQRFALVDEATDVRVHYTPHQVNAGVSYTTDAIVASLDAGWAHWSGFRGPYPLGVETPPYKDTFSIRFGAESSATAGTIFRAGYAFESSAIPATQPVTNLLDGTKHTVTGGAGYAAGKLRVDAHVLITIVTTRTLERMGQPKLKSGGELFGAGLSATIGF
ncbi:MAG TPA: hypothetical protein VLB44_18930 [Kofleriaceae bacterium]|nr:hypothetical protein [Kofleriaceae bacterium]